MSTVTSTDAVPLGRNQLARRGLTAAAVALAAVAIVRIVGVALAPDLAALDPFGWGAIVFVTLVAAVLGTLVYALVSRRENGDRLFVGLAAVVFLLSLSPIVFGAGPMPGMTTVGLVLLGVMHLVASIGIVVSLLGRARGLPA
ncbi:DUF6069 family protein [Halorarius litoreus]|uniref:DUF6069 family protein n=1 Tax=Halorarius litoreus TaxID=2962676 RepID=UPI0020CD0CA9|nr:DUF6069 family protein [Halorarius litoreus]